MRGQDRQVDDCGRKLSTHPVHSELPQVGYRIGSGHGPNSVAQVISGEADDRVDAAHER